MAEGIVDRTAVSAQVKLGAIWLQLKQYIVDLQ